MQMSQLTLTVSWMLDYIEGCVDSLNTALNYLETRKGMCVCVLFKPRLTYWPGPFAFLVKRQCFEKYKLKNKEPNNFELNREQAMGVVLKQLNEWDVIVATTGLLSARVGLDSNG